MNSKWKLLELILAASLLWAGPFRDDDAPPRPKLAVEDLAFLQEPTPVGPPQSPAFTYPQAPAYRTWTGPGSVPFRTVEQAIAHLVTHDRRYAGVNLRALSLWQLTALHSDEHENAVVWINGVPHQRARSVIQFQNCPNGFCPR